MIRSFKSSSAAMVALECAARMRKFIRDTTYGNIPRTYTDTAWWCNDGQDPFIEYIPAKGCTVTIAPGTPSMTGAVMDSIHNACKPGCDDSTHREF